MDSKAADEQAITSGSNDRKRKVEDSISSEKEAVKPIIKPETTAFDSEEDEENANEDNYVTMVDVLEEEQKLEEEAFALLGGSDDKNCTYLHGYVGRQAIYACKTCRRNRPETMDQEDISGVCLACSYACHEGHELYELYTKRNFKCDCGNTKSASGRPCTLFPKKSDQNELNKYNHNFFGRYCLCDRPYPDPEGDNSTMIQCIVCEDWFHDHCLKTKFSSSDDFGELICGPCMSNHSFLWCYQTEEIKVNNKSDSKPLSTSPSPSSSTSSSSSTAAKASATLSNSNSSEGEVNVTEFESKEQKNSISTTAATATTAGVNEPGTDSGIESSCDSMLDQCKLKTLQPHTNQSNRAGAAFWEEGWRKRLCRCTECLSMYRANQIEFLCDETDTVHHYEAKGKEQGAQMSDYERGLNEINKMDRVQSIEAITECNAMTLHFKEFLKKFAENKKIVRQKDIEQFFDELKSRKRQRLDNSYPY